MKSKNTRHTILYVHSSDEMYGADLILLQLIERLDKARFRAIVVLPTDVPYEGLLTNALQQRDIKTVHMKTAILRRRYLSPLGIILYLYRLVWSTFLLARLIRKERVALVHSNTLAVIVGALAARMMRIPHVWHVHEIIVHPRLLWRLTSWMLPHLSDRVVVVSGPTRDHLCKAEPRNAEITTIIHNGIDVERFNTEPGLGQGVRQEWGIRPEQPLVGMVGRVSHWKGQDYLLHVADLVTKRHPEAHFALVGGTIPGHENMVESLKALAERLHLSPRITISDFRADIPAILDAFDIFVLPSTLPDPFPTVVLEAMAAGKPVVANAHGGSTEMLEDGVTGYLVKPDRPEEMADAIETLIEHPLRRQEMGQRGRQRLIEHFSLEAFIANWTALYESLLYPQPATTILIVHSSDELYGSDWALLHLLRKMDRSQFRPLVVLPNDLPYEGTLSALLVELDIPIYHVGLAVLRRRYLTPWGIIRYLAATVSSTSMLVRLIHREKVDIVHSNTVAVLPGAWAARLTGRPHVWHVHEIVTRPTIFAWLFPRILPILATRLVVISTAVRDWICDSNPRARAKTILVPNGISLAPFDANNRGDLIRQEFGIPDKAPVIGTVGRLHWWKGQDILLRAAARLRENWPNLHVLIVGGTVPGQEDRLARLQQEAESLGLSRCVHWSGFRQDVPNLLAAMDIFVLPSVTPEPFGISLIEAMAARRPVIATKQGGPLDIVIEGETGLLVPPGDAGALADAIESLLNDPDYGHRMGIVGRDRIQKHYTVQQYATNMEQVYRVLRRSDRKGMDDV